VGDFGAFENGRRRREVGDLRGPGLERSWAKWAILGQEQVVWGAGNARIRSMMVGLRDAGAI
jgi:hypothetical protein